jgi:hypothetical protein
MWAHAISSALTGNHPGQGSISASFGGEAPKSWAKQLSTGVSRALALAAGPHGADSRLRRRLMPKRIFIGVVMILAGAGLLLPPAWTLFSPFLLQLVASSSGAGVTWLLTTLGGCSLLVMGVRRMLPARAPSRASS